MLDSIAFKSEFKNQEMDGYILDLLEILDIKILRLLIKIQNVCVESSNQGFSMNFIEIFKFFANEDEVHNTEELQQLKSAYISREMALEHKRQRNNLDLLCEKFSLPELNMKLLTQALSNLFQKVQWWVIISALKPADIILLNAYLLCKFLLGKVKLTTCL